MVKIRRYSARLSRIIVLLFHKLITKLVTFLNLSVDIFSLHFFFLRTKLHIPPDICCLRMTDIESIMTIFGQCYNLLNNYSAASCGIENFEFIVSERVQVNPDNSRAMSALTFLLFKLNTLQTKTVKL